MARVEPKMNPVPATVADQLNAVVDDINSHIDPPPMPREIYDWERLGKTVQEAMIETVQQVLNMAQAEMEATKRDAEQVAEIVRRRAQAASDLNGRLKALGEKRLEAHKQFLEGIE